MRLVRICETTFVNPDMVTAIYVGEHGRVMVATMSGKMYHETDAYHREGMEELAERLQACEENTPVAQ